ncbi:armadillo repeat only 4 [Perilla frutescens var. frutescens]|nr:armadillo repeat only 4 [Perilla frutescens var. frutescens]
MAAKPSSTAVTPTTIPQKLQPQKARAIEQHDKRIEEILSFPILLSDQIGEAVKEAESFKFECSEVGKQVERLCQMLRSAARLATAGAAFYDRPLRRIAAEVSKNLEKSLTLVKKCRRRSILRRVVTIVSVADFRKLLALLESSVADMKWVLSIFDGGAAGGGIVLTLPPIASNDPIISWVWSFTASLYMGQLQDKIEAANELASLAKDNDRNKQIIVEEGGVSPLLKLLKDSSSLEGQIAAAFALFNLANDQERVQAIIDELGVPIIVHVLGDSPMKVQIRVANLVAKMAEHCPHAQEDFARENVIRPLVTLLSFDLFVDDLFVDDSKLKLGKQSIHSLVQINKEMERKNLYKPGFGSSSLSKHYSEGSSKGGGNNRKERENEKPEVKLKLKTSCAEALWMLARGSVPNSRRITETKGLLCLAKIIEIEEGELKRNCLMTIAEITAAAESNADLRRAAFKTNSPAAKAVVDQLLRVIQESDEASLQVAAIRAIGSLARTFPARETRVLGPLVELLGHRDQDVAAEAASSLGKFTCPDNFLCVDHCKTIIEFRGVPPLIRLLRGNEEAQLHGLILTCYLAIHAGKSDELERAGVLNALEGVDRALVFQHPELKELIPQAIYHLSVFHQSHSGMLTQRQF